MPIFHRKKQYILMHRDVPVLKGEYSFRQHGFENVQIINGKHMPIGTVRDGKFSRNCLNDWIHWRGIPSYRVGLNQLLSRLDVSSPLDLLERSRMLSVSDCYWLKEEKSSSTWRKANFFRRDFDGRGFASAMFSQIDCTAERSARHTPNNTLAGYQRKAWMKDGVDLKLMKGGTGVQQEPVNEWLASQIAQYLGIDAVFYDTGVYENQVVSICSDMCDERTDLVPARDIMHGVKVPKGEFSFPYYLKELHKHGIENAGRCINDMLVLDYLMLNTDRHMQNMGVLVDAETMEWKKCAPVFDTGTSLGCLLDDESVMYAGSERKAVFFNARGLSHDQLLEIVNLKRYDFSGLEVLVDRFGDELARYQRVTGISDMRIDALMNVLKGRILRIQKAALRV